MKTNSRSPRVASEKAETTVDPAKIATPDLARADMVRYTGRGYTPVRHVFVQKYDGKDRSSTLALLCKNRKRRALILYLMLLTMWRENQEPRPSEVWLRLLAVTKGQLTWSTSSLSEGWTALVDMGLADRQRLRRMAHVVARREDARVDYTPPSGGSAKIDLYFALPGEFWTDKWFDALSLPAVCMLLLLLKETNDASSEFHITHEQVEDWYGISASSAAKGFAELERVGLVTIRREQVPAGLTKQGYTYHLHYSLTGAFSTNARKKARAAAKKAALAQFKQSASKKSAVATASKTRKSSVVSRVNKP